MDWMSTQEAAVKWGVSLRYVQRLLHAGRISGARKCGVTWMIPLQANKPPRGGITTREEASPSPAATTPGAAALFPLLHLRGGDLDAAYARCGDDAERKLLTAGLAFFRGDAAQARDLTAVLFKAASTPRQKLASGALLAPAYMSLCELRAWRATMTQLEAVDVSGSEVMEKQLLIIMSP